jgi:hypothetical protein
MHRVVAGILGQKEREGFCGEQEWWDRDEAVMI